MPLSRLELFKTPAFKPRTFGAVIEIEHHRRQNSSSLEIVVMLAGIRSSPNSTGGKEESYANFLSRREMRRLGGKILGIMYRVREENGTSTTIHHFDQMIMNCCGEDPVSMGEHP